MAERSNIVVLGAGESGVSAARLAQREGHGVFVSDAGAGQARFAEELQSAGIEYELNRHSERRILAADEVVKSPGIPDSAPLIVALRERGVPVISEIEFAARYLPDGCTVVGITGSNGKTTTTMLTQHLLASAGRRAVAGGNLGESLARLLLDREPQEVYVLELSSFQLDGIREFRPHIATVLNITPDHLDRYGYSLERYADAKLRITLAQQPGDTLLLFDDPHTLAPALRRQKTEAQIRYVSGEDVQDQRVRVGEQYFDLASGRLRGKHNGLNAAFAIRIALQLGVGAADIQGGLDSFQPAPHRMEIIPTADGRTWINDSKATNVDATYFALEAMDGPTVWIAGGTDKGNDYAALLPLVRSRVQTLICLGEDNAKLREAFVGLIPEVIECHSAPAAAVFATHRAKTGHNVLLSPACASFDLFKNYIDRGDQFRRAVQTLHA